MEQPSEDKNIFKAGGVAVWDKFHLHGMFL